MVRAVVERAGIDSGRGRRQDVLIGAAAQAGHAGLQPGPVVRGGGGPARQRAGMTMGRMCSVGGGLMTMRHAPRTASFAAEADIVVAGGCRVDLACTQNKHKNAYRAQSEAVLARQPDAYMAMIETAEVVAQRYGIARAAQDDYALRSRQRTAGRSGRVCSATRSCH
ncbi:thiolase family protein [Cupriavidus basilensis]